MVLTVVVATLAAAGVPVVVGVILRDQGRETQPGLLTALCLALVVLVVTSVRAAMLMRHLDVLRTRERILADLGERLRDRDTRDGLLETAGQVVHRLLAGSGAEALLLGRPGSDLDAARGEGAPDDLTVVAHTSRVPPPGDLRLPSSAVRHVAGVPAGGPVPQALADLLQDAGLGGSHPWLWWPVQGTQSHGCLLVRGRPRRMRDLTPALTGVAERLSAALTAHDLTWHDRLTELANRAMFTDSLRRVGRYRGGRIGVLCVNLDDFTTINDSLGHDVGDELLALVGRRLRSCVRANDVPARIGGDEFAVLLDDVASKHEAREIGVRLLDVLGAPLRLGADIVRLSASIGVETPADGDDLDDVLRRAHMAMRRAKRAGKARVEVFSGEEAVAAQLRYRLSREFPGALVRGELSLHYQPLVDLASGVPVGVEALARWQHPDLGFVPPRAFIPLAERDGSIMEIGEWVLRTACADLATWRARFPEEELWTSVNVSERQLADDRFDTRVLECLRRHGLPPQSLVLEFSETVLIDDPRSVQRLERLASVGVRLAVDDFGTGHASLLNLQRLPVSVLKVDRSFVVDGPEDIRPERGVAGRRAALARASVIVGQSLGLVTVAEGLESEAQLQAMHDLGCTIGQGYLLARPMARSETGRWLTARFAEPVPAVRQAVRARRGAGWRRPVPPPAPATPMSRRILTRGWDPGRGAG